MADAVHTRRAILRAIPSVTAAVSLPACAVVVTAAEHPDAELIRLSAELDAMWAAELEALAASERLDDREADAVYEAASDATGMVVDRIEAQTAKTLDGLKVQAKAVKWCCGSDPEITFGGTTDERLAAKIGPKKVRDRRRAKERREEDQRRQDEEYRAKRKRQDDAADKAALIVADALGERLPEVVTLLQDVSLYRFRDALAGLVP